MGEIEKKDIQRDGQSALEYALIFAVVAAAFLAMSLYVQRSVQANLKLLEDRINAEQNP